MITFGFRNRFSGIVRAVAALALGLLLLIRPDCSISIIVKILASFLVASGIVSLVFGIINRENRGVGLMYVNALIDVVLGTLIFIFSEFVGTFILYLLGAALLIFGIFQIVILVSLISTTGPHIFGFLLPALAAIGGAILLFDPFSKKVMGIIAGVALVVYGVSELIATWRVKKAMEGMEDGVNIEIHTSGPSSTFQEDDNIDEQ